MFYVFDYVIVYFVGIFFGIVFLDLVGEFGLGYVWVQFDFGLVGILQQFGVVEI